MGKKAIQSTIKGHIFWVEADDGKQYRHRVINYHDFKYNLDEGPSHNYFITLRLKDIDDPETQTIDCKTSLNYDYPTEILTIQTPLTSDGAKLMNFN